MFRKGNEALRRKNGDPLLATTALGSGNFNPAINFTALQGEISTALKGKILKFWHQSMHESTGGFLLIYAGGEGELGSLIHETGGGIKAESKDRGLLSRIFQGSPFNKLTTRRGGTGPVLDLRQTIL